MEKLSKPLFWLIPRELWDAKPETVSREFAKVFRNSFYNAGGSRPTTLIGEFYWNFHIIGVVFGMFILGYLLKKVRVLSQASYVVKADAVGYYALLISPVVSIYRGGLATYVFSLAVFLVLPFYISLQMSKVRE